MTELDEARERLARALAESGWPDATALTSLPGVTYGDLRALIGGGGVPAGCTPVPVEPTESMLRAWLTEEYAQCTSGSPPDPAKCYAALLSASTVEG
jgi:hypothetical protein